MPEALRRRSHYQNGKRHRRATDLNRETQDPVEALNKVTWVLKRNTFHKQRLIQ